MGKVLVTESHLLGIADAIRTKNGLTTKYKPSEMSDAISAISTGELPNYRKYTVTLASDVVGTDEKALLLTDSIIAQHYADDSFKIEVRLIPATTQAYSVIEVTAYNIPEQEPYRTGGTGSVRYQYTTRIGSTDGVISTNIVKFPISNTGIGIGTPGRVLVDVSGNLYLISGSTSYAIRAGTYVVEIFW